MANEITINLNFQVQNPASGGGYLWSTRLNAQFNQNSLGANGQTVSVPTAAASYTFSNITTLGWVFLQNLDATNYVDYGVLVSSTFYPLGRLKGGEFAILRISPAIGTFAMQANTAAVDVNYQLFND